MPDYPSLLLKGNDIDVWLVHYSEIVDERLLARMYELLNEAERYKHARFYFKEDRKRYLVTRAMVRTVLSYYAMVAPSDWVFGTNAYGRPIIANKCPDAATLSFNISHTLGLIAIAAGRERELGIDIENVAASEISPDLAGHFFSPQEAAALQELPPEQRQARFFEYWTFKESYIKARGMGLSLPLDGFSFQFPSDKAVRLTVSTELGDDGNRWHFRQYRPTAAHLLALCAERRAGNPTVVTMRGMIPTVGYETLIPVLLKASDSD